MFTVADTMCVFQLFAVFSMIFRDVNVLQSLFASTNVGTGVRIKGKPVFR